MGIRTAIIMAAALLAGAGARAETRVALIVGNASYVKPEMRLANPERDAASMQQALQSAGFATIVRINASRVAMYRAVDEFSSRIARDPQAVGLFYYAGHGVQVNGTNYLIPVDADIQSVPDLEANAFDVNRVLRAMQDAQNEMNIVILDACRNNPLPKSRGVERGLARMNAPAGTFIAYAAAPGQTAQDGRIGANGVFTGELVRAMALSDVPIEQMYKKVIASVRADTHGGQQPWSESSIQGDFYFHVGGAAGSGPGDGRGAPGSGVGGASGASGRASDVGGAGTATRLKPRARSESGREASAASKGAGNGAPQAPSVAPKDTRCSAIVERAQLGEPLNENDRAFLATHCQ